MKQLELTPLNIQRAMSLLDVQHHLDDDLVITNFDTVPLPEECRRTECTIVVLCTAGMGRYTLGTVEYTLKTNDVLIAGEGQVLGDIKVVQPLEGIIIFISNAFLYSIIREVRDIANLFVITREHPVFSLSPADVLMFRKYLSFLKAKLAEESHLFRRQIAGTLLATMIYELCNITQRITEEKAPKQSRSQEVFERFIQLVENNFRTERRVAWYSEKLGISSKTLLEVVKRVSSRTPNDWLDIYTTLEIRIMLRHTTMSIKQIADTLHFSNQSSLGKFFREHVGMSPKAYRISQMQNVQEAAPDEDSAQEA